MDDIKNSSNRYWLKWIISALLLAVILFAWRFYVSQSRDVVYLKPLPKSEQAEESSSAPTTGTADALASGAENSSEQPSIYQIESIEHPEKQFLATDYNPLNEWLDQRFEVKYLNLTPEIIFDQAPLNDVHYETTSLPELVSVSSFSMNSANISRRELLEEISKHWNLQMSFSYDGTSSAPNAIAVTGKQ